MRDTPTADLVLKHHGKTFHYARRFLGRDHGHAVARLYRFCRYIDDLADETSDIEISRQQLTAVRRELAQGRSRRPVVEDFLALAGQWRIEVKRGEDLVDGVLLDLNEVRIADEVELLRYCYHVAGAVGLMMCPLLGADPAGAPFAVDLGVAMQLTNIARDVRHDADRGRRYLPGSWVEELSAGHISLAREADRAPVQRAIRHLLERADAYYVSGTDGLAHLPLRSRLSIAIAARTYREIGAKLLRNGCPWWDGRTYTTTMEKSRLAAAVTLSELLRLFRRRPRPHDQTLHRHILDLVNPLTGDR